MIRLRQVVCLVSVFLVLAPAGFGQVAPQESPEVIRARATTVLVDVIVRQRDGRAMRGLSPEQFQVLEEGVPQRIVYFQEVGRAVSTPRALELAQAEPSAAEPAPVLPSLLGSDLVQERFTALVFDRLSPTSRSYARQAALSFVDQAAAENPRIGVFVIDLAMRTVTFYTRDLEAAKAAIDRATGAAGAQFSSVQAEASAAAQLAERAAEVAAATASQVTPGPGMNLGNAAEAAAAASADAILAAMQARMAETLEVLQRDQQGYATTDGLMAVVRALGLMPARKTVVFFSEGVALPEAVMKRFRSVIHAANRANVAVYTVDAAGLRVESTGDASGRAMSALAGSRLNQAFSGREDTSGPMLRQLERNEDLIRSDPHTGLTMLAEETGAFLIRDTNNLSAGLGRIAEDMESYYLLAYAPSNQEMDGRFRRIEVKVDASGARTQFRRGYYAVDVSLDQPLLEYEAPAMALVARARHDNAFEMRAGVFSFPKPDAAGATALLVDVPPGTVTYAPEGKDEVSDFTIVAVISRPDGEIVQKTSQQYKLARSMVGGGDGILFYRELEIPPGRYRVEVAAFDAVGGKGAVHESNLEVTLPDPGMPVLSSLIVVGGAEPVRPGSSAAGTLLSTGELLLYPNLESPIPQGSVREIPFYFQAYSRGRSLGEAYVELLEHGRRVSLTRINLPGADADGRIRYMGSIPAAELAPGVYTLQILLPVEDKLVGRSRRLIISR